MLASGRFAVTVGALDAPPVFDGMIAANGRIFVALANGAVECW